MNIQPPSILQEALVPSLPSAAYYIPEFISRDEERVTTDHILKIPQSRWTQLSHRRLLSLPSPLTGTGRDTLLSAPLPAYLSALVVSRFEALAIFAASPHGQPNHVLVNEYKSGEGIMPHEDGPSYYPITATVSLGSHCVLDVYEKTTHGEREAEPRWRILQEPRSLLITTGDMYRTTLHGISEIEADGNLGPDTIANWNLLGDSKPFEQGDCARQTRLSLTFRDVHKVMRLGSGLKFMSKK